MRGADVQQGGLFSYVPVESRIPANHPLRSVRVLLDEALASMIRDFDRVYAEGGRGSVPPERLVRALVLQVLNSIRSERLIESWATVKSMRRRDGRDEPPGPGRNPAVDFHGERRTSEAHGAPYDPEGKLGLKAQSAPAKLHYLGHVLMEHRTGLSVDVEVTEANGFAEREAALTMLERLPRRCGTDGSSRTWRPTTVVRAARGSTLDARGTHTTRHAGYRAGQRPRKRVEEIFGWGKDGRPMRKMKVRGLAKLASSPV